MGALLRSRGDGEVAKPYPGAPRRALAPSPDSPAVPLAEVVRARAPEAGFGAAPLSRGELARLLRAANGVTGAPGAKVPLRAAPSAGALYASELYLVARRVEGLAPGLYYYAVLEDALVELRRGDTADEVERTLERPAGVADAAAFVLIANVFGRYSGRYGERGYRYALIDTGHIGENLRLATRSAGLAHAAPPRFEDERLNRLLGVDGRAEAVCALHALGPEGPAAGEAPRRRALRERGGVSGGSASERFHRASELVGGEDEAEAGAPPVEDPEAAAGTPLPRGAATGTTVEEAIARRRSALRFEAAPLALRDLSLLLELARGTPPLGPDLALCVVAHRVRDLAPGLYRYRGPDRGLEALRRGDLASDMTRACLGQDMAGEAAAGLLAVAGLERAARLGARPYRDLLIEAGALGQRVYLGAETLGLTARNLAAFWDDALNGLLGFDGRRRAVVHLTLAGPGR